MNSKKVLLLMVLCVFSIVFAMGAQATVNLISPANNSWTSYNATTLNFTYNISAGGSALLSNCSLYIDGVNVNTTFNVVNDTNTIVQSNSTITETTHTWNVICINGTGYQDNSSYYTINNDYTAPLFVIVSTIQPDSLYSNFAGNNIINVTVNATDASGAGIKQVEVNWTTLGCGYVNATSSNGLWISNCTPTLFNYSFTAFNITAKLYDNITLGDIHTTSSDANGNTYTYAILYNFTIPTGMAGIQRFGSDTTNLSQQLNFSSINYVLDIELNTSLMGGSGTDYANACLLNFTTLDFTSPTIGTRLANLFSAIQVNISQPHSYGLNRIYVNSTAFSELDTTTIITLYNLPFTSEPDIEDDPTAAGGVSISSWVSSGTQGNLTFSVDGFSGYNITDSVNPITTITYPTASLATTTSLINFNFTFNGTGTEIDNSSINVTLVGSSSTLSFNYTNLTCSNINTEVIRCNISRQLTNGSYNFTTFVKDYGGSAGKNVTSTVSNIIVDTVNPENVSVSCSNVYKNDNRDCTCTADDNSESFGGTISYAYSGDSTFTTGTTTVTCTATDLAGNTATGTDSYTVSEEYVGGGSGGSAGGISSSIANQFAQKTWASINAGETASVTVTNGDIGVTDVSFVVTSTAWGAWIKVQKEVSLPTGTTKFNNQVYKYIQITKGPSLKDSIIQNAKINFKVEKAWMTTNKWTKDSAGLFRLVDNKWTELKTSFVKEDDKYFYYSAETPGFSYFLIGQKSAVIAPVAAETEVTAPAPATSITETNAEAETAEAPETEGTLIWPWIALVVLIIAAIIGYAYWRNR